MALRFPAAPVPSDPAAKLSEVPQNHRTHLVLVSEDSHGPGGFPDIVLQVRGPAYMTVTSECVSSEPVALNELPLENIRTG